MFARHADTFFPAVKRVKGLEVREHDTTDLAERRLGRGVSSEARAEFPEDPGPALGGATDHHAVGSALYQRLQGLGRTIDVAVYKYRQVDGTLDLGRRLVLSLTGEEIGARAAVHGESRHALALRDARDRDRVAVLAVPARAHLERDRHARGCDHRGQDGCDQRLIAHERGACGPIADLLGGAAEVDVDDLCPEVRVHARGLGHHRRVVAGDLHDAGLGLAAVIEPMARLGRIPEPDVRRHHLGCGDARTHAAAKTAKRQVRDAGHRREREWRRELVRSDLH